MKKFLIKLAIFAVIIVGLDFCVGIVCKYMQYHTKGGDTGRMLYIADKMDAQVLIFGSSRAVHHYNPTIIEDSIHMSCYNCGKDGNGIIFNYGQYKLYSHRYTPKVIIYDLIASFDLINEHNDEKYLSWLRYFYDREGIDSIFWSVDHNERWKMMSYMRMYNEKFTQLASDYHSPMRSDIKGYRPLHGTMNYTPAPEIVKKEQAQIIYDSLKIYYFNRLISDCKHNGTILIFSLSPLYHSHHASTFDPIIALAQKEGIPFIDHYCDSDICNDNHFFVDTSHMNDKGADYFTRKIIKEIRAILKQTYHNPKEE